MLDQSNLIDLGLILVFRHVAASDPKHARVELLGSPRGRPSVGVARFGQDVLPVEEMHGVVWKRGGSFRRGNAVYSWIW